MAGAGASRCARDTARKVSAPAAGHLKGRYPLESVTVLSVAAAGQGAVLASETGAALLCSVGLRLGTGAIFGAVGVGPSSLSAHALSLARSLPRDVESSGGPRAGPKLDRPESSLGTNAQGFDVLTL